MSDFAIGFYEIIYKDNLVENNILHDKGHLINKQFAGDTMNSFNHIANLTPGAGNTKSKRTSQERWPYYLKEYYDKYHCLANFWIIPMRIGRLGAKLNRYDSVELFINRIKDEEKILKTYNQYFEKLTKNNFERLHYIQKIRNEVEVKELYSKRDTESLVKNALNDIDERAKIIAKSKYANELYEYFSRFDLIDDK